MLEMVTVYLVINMYYTEIPTCTARLSKKTAYLVRTNFTLHWSKEPGT